MATIDVSSELTIGAAPAAVAGVMFDPERDPHWMKAVTGVELIDAALAPGARVRRRGIFLGREMSWVTEVDAVHFPHLLRLRVIEGPFLGIIEYAIQRDAGGSRVRIRNTGEAGALGFLPAALIEGPMRSALAGDLERLKALVEA